MGSFVAVDDLGSAADVSLGELGTTSVCRVGAYGDDVCNNVKSTCETEDAVDVGCMVCPYLSAASAHLDGTASMGEGDREGTTGCESWGENGPGHDLSPRFVEMFGCMTVESELLEKNVTLYCVYVSVDSVR